MVQKPVVESIFGGGGGGGCGDMKRSPSELALEELFSEDTVEIPTQRARVFDDPDALLGLEDHPKSFADVCAGSDLTFPYRNQEIMSSFPSGELTDTFLWSENVTSKQSSISAPIDSQSSICVSSPNSATKSKGRDNQATGATSGSSHEQSDDDDIEIEAGPCEQSTDNIDVKRVKRMASNRESARRSRSRKQAHLAELEQQVENMRGDNASLFKQLTDATQQFKDATTNNRVLKSDVEALRAKVKLAEDMVARGSLTSSLSHLLQNHLSTPQAFSSHSTSRLGNVTPMIPVHGDDDVPYPGMTVSGQNSTLGLENADAFNGSVKNGNISDAVSCVSENWAWEPHVPTVSK